jgi:hypothetical protein
MKAESTIQRELQRVVSAKRLAAFLHEERNQDWLYGAEQALAWVLGLDAMRASTAFRLGKSP